MSSRKLFYMTTVCTFLLSFNHAMAETIVCPGGNCNNNTVSSLGGDASQMDVNEGGTANGNEVSNGGVMNVNKAELPTALPSERIFGPAVRSMSMTVEP